MVLDEMRTEIYELKAEIKRLRGIISECKELFDVTFIGDSQCKLKRKLETLEDGN